MLNWTQVYSPVAGSLGMSALVAALPVVVLLGLLAFGHVKAHWAALAGLATSLAVAILVFGMPAQLAGAAALMGAAYGLFPIGWIVLGAIFIYDVTVKSGDFEIVKDTIAGVGSDRRVQVLLIAFCFGAFIEGAAGFGTPVAISAAMLIGLGFRPLQAAGLALIANTAPVAFGALGIPVITLATVTGLPVDLLSAMVGRILVLFCVAVPFWVIWTMCGRKQMMEVWPACLTVGITFGATQYGISNYIGPSLAAIGASVVSMAALIVLLKFWQPATIWSFDHEDKAVRAAEHANLRVYTGGRKLKAWMPWILLSAFVFVWGLTPVKTFLNGGAAGHPNFLSGISSLNIPVPVLHKAVTRTPPVVAKPSAEPAIFVFNWASATGHQPATRGNARRLAAGPYAAQSLLDSGGDAAADSQIAADHRRHARAGLLHPVRGPGRHHGPGVRQHRRTLPVLLAPARLAWRGAHRQRHLLQRAVRRATADHRPPGGCLARTGGRGEQRRRRDGQND